jgi:hypothetical protein
MDVYLDIDGVLLTRDNEPALYAHEFLRLVLEKCPDSTYWLTTHCKGDATVPIKRIGHLFDAETLALMRMIKPTTWDLAKTDAIEFSRPFLWFDDNCFDFEKRILQQNGLIDNWIEVDLRKTPHQLGMFIQSFPLPINDLR